MRFYENPQILAVRSVCMWKKCKWTSNSQRLKALCRGPFDALTACRKMFNFLHMLTITAFQLQPRTEASWCSLLCLMTSGGSLKTATLRKVLETHPTQCWLWISYGQAYDRLVKVFPSWIYPPAGEICFRKIYGSRLHFSVVKTLKNEWSQKAISQSSGPHPELNVIVPHKQFEDKEITLLFLGNMPIAIYLYI